MRQAVFLAAAREDLVNILVHVTETSGSFATGSAAVASRRAQYHRLGHRLAALPGTLGRPRPDLRHDIRSFPFRNHVIYFRLCADRFEVVNILHSRRDVPEHFAPPEDG